VPATKPTKPTKEYNTWIPKSIDVDPRVWQMVRECSVASGKEIRVWVGEALAEKVVRQRRAS